MSIVQVIEQAGLRVINGHMRVESALSLGHVVMATDADGSVYRIAVEDNSLVVQEVPDAQPDDSMIIVERL